MVEIIDNNEGRFCYIKQVDNGFMLQTENSIMVVEEKESGTDHDELVAMNDLLWNVKESFGIHFKKHNKENIQIHIEQTNKE